MITPFALILLTSLDFITSLNVFSYKKYGIMKNLRLQSTNDNSGRLERDKIWYDEGNKVEYVMGSTSMFQSLEELGLNISTGLSTRNIIPHHLTSSSDMFCNRELNMQNIEALGFDMDWTLAQYNEEFDLLAFNGAKEKLISLLGYPDEVMKFTYTQSMYRRCCMIDKKRGNIIKFDRHRYVRIAEHGLTPLSTVERKTTYKNTYQELQEINSLVDFASIDTPFGLVDAALFAQLVDLKDRLGGTYRILQEKSYKDLWNDLRNCVNRCHMDGVIKLEVARNPSKYISYDPNIFPMLKAFREAGVKVFLLTNSLMDYTQVVMNYLEGKKSGSKLDLAWSEYFDIIIVGGNKPNFIDSDRKSIALYRIDPIDDTLQDLDDVPSDAESVNEFLKQGKFFQGGNALALHKLLRLSSGDRLLYVGDHMYADILRSKRTLGWRTCLILPELTEEIMTTKKLRYLLADIKKLRTDQYNLQIQLDQKEFQLWELKKRLETSGNENVLTKDALQLAQLSQIVSEMNIKLKQIRAMARNKLQEHSSLCHPRWGPLFKAGYQQSRFAMQIVDFACVYTSRASNLGFVSPQRPFRAIRDKLPHEEFLEESQEDLGFG